MKLSTICDAHPWTPEQGEVLRLAYECAVLMASHPTLEEGLGGAFANLAKAPGRALKYGYDTTVDKIDRTGKNVEASATPWRTLGKELGVPKAASGALKGAKWAGKKGMGLAKGVGKFGLGALSALGKAFTHHMTNSGGGGGGGAGAGKNAGATPKWSGFGGDTRKITQAFMTILGELDRVPGHAQKSTIDALGKALQHKAIKLGGTGKWVP